MNKKTILILAANPKDTSRMRLDEEVRDVEAVLQRAGKRDEFELRPRLAARSRDVQTAMLELNPAIVHFSGHGMGNDGLVFEDVQGLAKPIGSEALAGLFELFVDRVECVILNACYSEVQAEAIARHIPHVIGMTQPIGDRASIEFSFGFYQALGAGRSHGQAFRFGRSAIQMAGLEGSEIPVLKQSGALIKETPLQSPTPTPSLAAVPVAPVTKAPVTKAPAPKVDLSQGPGGERLYRALLNLGYQKQAKFFMQLKRAHDVAALLIYGLPEHGQRWLLNLLVLKFLPELMNGKLAKIDLRDVSQKRSVNALWRQFGRQFGVRGRSSSRLEITQAVHRCLESQDILLAIHGVDSTIEAALQELIEQFWLPLIDRLEGERVPGTEKHKLFLFLLDYKGVTEQWEVPFVEKINLKQRGRLERPARSPKLEQFSTDELEDWLVGAYGDLPDEVADNISDKIEEIIEGCDDGIPEMVLEELCDYCGVDWFAVRSRWMRL